MLDVIGGHDYSTLDWVQFWSSLLNIVGLAALYSWVRHLIILKRPGHKILRLKNSFRNDHPLFIVFGVGNQHNAATERGSQGVLDHSSAHGKNDHQETNCPQCHQPVVNLWTSHAVRSITELSSTLGYRKSFEIAPVGRLAQKPTDDLVVIGGRIRNALSKQFSDLFNAHHPELRISRHVEDPHGIKSLSIGQEDFDFLPRKDEETGRTVYDRAILILWRNPFRADGKRRRGILCAGFTSMGSAGAAQYLNESLQNGSLRRLWKAHGGRRWTHRKFPEFIVVLDVHVNNKTYIEDEKYLEVRPVKLIPISKHFPIGRKVRMGADETQL